jgi:AcrR family transcriptional regulator
MRITTKARAENRIRILKEAANLFKNKGFSQTTTRDIARATGIATGTLFNYFATKEDLVLALVGICLKDAEADFQRRRHGGENLDELLFAYAATSLRHLRHHRGYVEIVLRAGTGSSQKSRKAGEAERIRAAHLETVTELIGAFDGESLEGVQSFSPTGLDLHLYWTLFLGVLNFWAGDESPHQEETLALLDQSMKLFVESLAGRQNPSMEVDDGQIPG